MKKKIPTEYLQYLAKESNLEADQQSATGIPMRGILIGAVLSFLINFLDVYCTLMIRGSYLTLNFSTPAALFFFFILVLASGLVALIRRPLALSQTELITIYIMMIVSCCVPSMGLTPVLLPQLVGPIYYASPRTTGPRSTTSSSQLAHSAGGKRRALFLRRTAPGCPHSLGALDCAPDLLVRVLPLPLSGHDVYYDHPAQAVGGPRKNWSIPWSRCPWR